MKSVGKPNHQKSLDFLVGHIWREMECNMFKVLQGKQKVGAVQELNIPKSWFGLKSSKDPIVTVDAADAHYIMNELKKWTSIHAPKFEIKFEYAPYEQYIKFLWIWNEKKKKMTVSEIEKILGYPIEIVAEEWIDA